MANINNQISLLINGVEPIGELICPPLDSEASIQISDDLIEIYQSRIDALINQLGKKVLLEFNPVRSPCPNCLFDQDGKRSTGIYIPGGPRPFQRGRQCPWCKGRGFEETIPQRCIKCLSKWNPKEQANYGISVSDSKDTIRLKTFKTNYKDLIKAKTAIVHRDIRGMVKFKVRRLGQPYLVGLRNSRYCISFWELIDD